MGLLLRRLADNRDPRSMAGRLRQARFEMVRRLVQEAERRPVQILDVGGDPRYWTGMEGFAEMPAQVTLLNLWPYEETLSPKISSVVGDGRQMPQFADGAFDVVHANSVIEHLGSLAAQAQMAAEIRRVGRAYFVQTPYRHFPLEPHTLLPFFQYLPGRIRVAIVSRWRPGWYRQLRDRQAAVDDARRIRLLTAGEMSRLFPEGQIWHERLWGVTKSLVAVGKTRRLE